MRCSYKFDRTVWPITVVILADSFLLETNISILFAKRKRKPLGFFIYICTIQVSFWNPKARGILQNVQQFRCVNIKGSTI